MVLSCDSAVHLYNPLVIIIQILFSRNLCTNYLYIKYKNKICFFQIKKLKQALEDEKAKTALSEKYPSPRASHSVNGPDLEVHNAQSKCPSRLLFYFASFMLLFYSVLRNKKYFAVYLFFYY